MHIHIWLWILLELPSLVRIAPHSHVHSWVGILLELPSQSKIVHTWVGILLELPSLGIFAPLPCSHLAWDPTLVKFAPCLHLGRGPTRVAFSC